MTSTIRPFGKPPPRAISKVKAPHETRALQGPFPLFQRHVVLNGHSQQRKQIQLKLQTSLFPISIVVELQEKVQVVSNTSLN